MGPKHKSIREIIDRWNAHQTINDPLVLSELHEAMRNSTDYQTDLEIGEAIARVRGYGNASPDVAHLFSNDR